MMALAIVSREHALMEVKCPSLITRCGKNGWWQRKLEEPRDQLRTVEHLALGDRDFQEAWGAYRIALRAFNDVTNKL